MNGNEREIRIKGSEIRVGDVFRFRMSKNDPQTFGQRTAFMAK